MRTRDAVGVVAIVVGLVWAAAPSTAATKVFLLGGQSNMDGYGISAALPAPYNAPQPAVQFWSNNAWTNLRGGLGSSTAGYAAFGPEVTFGYQIHAMFPGDNIYLVKYAAGGTALADAADQWTPDGNGGVYNAFKSTVDAALLNLTNAGLSPSIAGMIWMQGEADTEAPYAPLYAANLTNFIGKVRSDFATPNMPFVLGRIMSYSQYPFGTPSDNALVRTAQVTVGTQVPNTSWVNTDNLEVYPLGAGWQGHYDTAGQIGLGNLFASKFIQTPEPGTLMLLATGLLGALAYAWRTRS